MKDKKTVFRAVIPFILVLLICLPVGCAGPAEPDSPAVVPIPPAPASPSGPINPPPAPEPPDASPKVSDIAAEILESQTFPEMVEINAKKTELFYGLNEEAYDSCAIFLCAESQAYEVAVIKARENQANVVLKGIEDRLLSQKDGFRDYMPDQYNLLENALVKANGNYILFVVSDDTALCEKIFDKYFS